MSISLLTLLGEMLTFAIFIWVVYKFVIPPLMTAIEERQNKISKGLAAAEEAKVSLEQAQSKSHDLTKDARTQSAEIIATAEKKATAMIEQAKVDAKIEGVKQLDAAKGEIEHELAQTKEELRGKLSDLVLLGVGQILEKEVDDKKHTNLIENLAKQL